MELFFFTNSGMRRMFVLNYLDSCNQTLLKSQGKKRPSTLTLLNLYEYKVWGFADMCESITISKNVLSKLALLQTCAESSGVYSIEETDSHWILSSPSEQESVNMYELCHKCLEKEAQILIEATVAPLRELLYRKAFEPVTQRK